MKLKVKCYICGVALIILYLSVTNWNYPSGNLENPSAKNKSGHMLNNENVTIEKEFTVIFRYTHDTSKYLTETVNSFLSNFPLLPVIIVSDTAVPREVLHSFSSTNNLRNIFLKLDLLNLILDRNVANYIKTKYVLLAPTDVISPQPNDVYNLIKVLQNNKQQLLGLPVDKRNFKCLKLKLNLVQWSMEYKFNEFGIDCDCIKGDHGIFMLTKVLGKIQEPFMLPFPDAFYIQTTSLNIKIKPINNITMSSKHEESKKDDLQKYQIQKQIMNKLFKIKKVVTENGIVEWYGCTRNTQRCFSNVINSIPDYLNQGRWTPPCCLRVLKETVHHVFKVLKEWNVTFWLEGGSLLGAMRTKDIIPWDYDVDIGVYVKDIKKCPWLRVVSEEFFKKKQLPSVVDNEGFVWERARPEEGDFYRVQASIHNRLHVDIFPFYARNGIMTKKTWFASHPQDMEFPEHYLKPLTTIEFAGIEAPAPNNVKEFLELKFGKGCVENPMYPNPKLFPFPESAKHLVVNETYSYDGNLNLF